MYISCYHQDELNFEHHGEFKVFVDEDNNNLYRSLNGQCYATFTVSHSDKYVNYLLPGMYIKIPTPNKNNKNQIFRIMDLSDSETGIEFTAYPYVWILASGFIPHINMINKTRLEAAQYILDKAQETKPHRVKVIEKQVQTDIKNLQIVRYSPLVALMGDKQNTVLNRYPVTEFDFDNFEIHLYNRLGDSTDFVIRENKNIESYTRDLDHKSLATRIIPQGGNELLLPEYYVDSPKINDYTEIYYKHIEFPDIAVDHENGIDEEMAINLLREAAVKMFSESHIDEPILNWTIAFDDWQDNEALPQKLRDLLKLDLGDSVRAIKSGMTQAIEARIVEYNYNFVKEKYSDVSISNQSQFFTVSVDKTISQVDSKVYNVVGVVNNLSTDMLNEIKKIESSLSDQIKESSKEITDKMGKEFERVDDELKKKTTEDDVKDIIEKNPDSVKTGFNQINPILEIDDEGFKVKHSDTSYSILSEVGLIRLEDKDSYNYHYLSYSGEFELQSQQKITVQLPEVFKNKQFTVVSSIKKIKTNYDTSQNRYLLLSFESEISDIDLDNANFSISSLIQAVDITDLSGQIIGVDYGHDLLTSIVSYWVYA